MQNVSNFSAVKIALASPDRIRLWSRGENSSPKASSQNPTALSRSSRPERMRG